MDRTDPDGFVGRRRIPVEIFVGRRAVRLCHVSNRGVAVSSILDFYRVCLCRQPLDLGEAQGQSGSVVVSEDAKFFPIDLRKQLIIKDFIKFKPGRSGNCVS